ncbi:MAG TPA: HEAT repeat domain-containing protein [Gemmatimonadales bacterium]|nr:HEAT repeat domain-containing protein [Gemmatimonadales bacterium]
MTAGAPTPAMLEAALVGEFLNTLVKALRAFQMYLPNNPIHQRAVQNVRGALAPIWSSADELVLAVGESEFRWEDEVVYSQASKNESLCWLLYKDGMRILTIRRGAEDEEIVRFLDVMNRVRFLPADAEDDLLTLLWGQDFQYITYHFIDFFGEGESLGESVTVAGGEETAPATAEERRAQVQEEAPPRPKGIVDIEDFDSTLYFLEEAEINYVVDEVHKEYRRDVRQSALYALFDLFEHHADPAIRLEILGVLDTLFPNLLNKGEFRTVAMVMRETRLIASRAPQLTDEQRRRLQDFESQLSQPSIVAQLIQSLEESGATAGDEDVTEVLRELRPSALGTLVAAVPKLANVPLRQLLQQTVDRLATQHPAEIMRLLREPADDAALASVIALCGRLQLQQAVAGLGETITHPDAAVRLASVQALAEIGSPGALTHIDRAIEDADRSVRLAAVRLVGARGYKGALRRVEAAVLGKAVKEFDLTEKMAFFEAYGAIAGPAALKTLEGMLLPRGLLKLRESAEIRACAAIALGKIRTAEARAILARAADDKELVVRNAVNRALREFAA